MMKTIGWIMIGVPFGGLFVGLLLTMVESIGWRASLLILGAIALLIGWLYLAAHLIAGG